MIKKVVYYAKDFLTFLQYTGFVIINDVRHTSYHSRKLFERTKKTIKSLTSTTGIVFFLIILATLSTINGQGIQVLLLCTAVILIHGYKEYTSGKHRGWERKKRYARYSRYDQEQHNPSQYSQEHNP